MQPNFGQDRLYRKSCQGNIDMRVAKVNGRTVTEFKNGKGPSGNLLREISVGSSDPRKIKNLMEQGKPLISQWISAIDRIFSKPKNGPPSVDQFNRRQKLSEACWSLLMEKALLSKEFEQYWWQRVHPYGQSPKKFEKESKPRLLGRWYNAFSGDETYTSIANRIFSHLHESELRLDGKERHPSNKRGLIESRANAVANSVFKSNLVPSFADPWGKEKSEYKKPKDDIAETIRAELEKLETKKKLGVAVARKTVGQLLSDHIKHVTGSKQCLVPAEHENAPLLELHNRVKTFYARLVRRGVSKQKLARFPEDMDALFRMLDLIHKNSQVNHLVRIGRILKYSDKGNFEKSHFWTSRGQAEIKEAETFVRVWRSAVSLGSRATKAWVDPGGLIVNQNNGDQDITSNGNINTFVASEELRQAALERIGLYFGTSGLFADLLESEQKQIFDACLRFMSTCRNNAFHFKTRPEMVEELKKELSTPLRKDRNNNVQNAAIKDAGLEDWSETVKKKVLEFLEGDMKALNERLLSDLQGAQIDRFANNDQFKHLVTAIQEAAQHDNSDVTLPGFKRLLRRSTNLAEFVGGLQQTQQVEFTLPTLPPLPKDLKDSATNARYIGLQALYNGPFRCYIDEMGGETLMGFIKQADKNTTRLAKAANRNAPYFDAIKGRANSLLEIGNTENIVAYCSRLTEYTAQEFKVQKGYESDSSKAREQAEFIEDFKRDFVALAFAHYLNKNNFAWLCEIEPEAAPAEDPADPPETTTVPSETSAPPEQWQAGLYLVLHFIPFDGVSRLLHQFIRWGALQSKHDLTEADTAEAENEVNHFKQTLALYLKMHEGKIDGTGMATDLGHFRALYEDEATFNKVFLGETTDTDLQDRVSQTHKGLRHILRYNHMPALEHVFEKQKVTKQEVQELEKLEDKPDENTLSPVGQAQQNRTTLHDKAVEKKKRLSEDEVETYRTAIATIARHRALKNKVYLGDHVRVHRLLMNVLARLVDYAGLYERDCARLIPTAIAYLNDNKHAKIAWQHPHADAATKTRNNLAHFNVLDRESDINLTELINRVRDMMAYDRKLKNAVTKSIREMLEREGITLKWDMTKHKLCNATINAVPIHHFGKTRNQHLKGKKLYEPRHNRAFLEMVAVLFDGKVVAPNQTPAVGARLTGTFNGFLQRKTFGFIKVKYYADVFVHISAFEQAGICNPSEGMRLSFTVENGKNKGSVVANSLRLKKG